MRAGRCVGVLSLDELEGVNRLPAKTVVQRHPVPAARRQVEPSAGRVVVDLLGRVRVVRPQIDVWAVRRLVRERIEDPRDRGAERGIGREGGALLGQRDQHVAVHVSALALLGKVRRQRSPGDEGNEQVRAVVVGSGGLHRPDLEERSRGENAVAVCLVDRAVEIAPRRRTEMDRTPGWVPELAAEVALRRCELAHNRRLGAHPHVDFILDVVVDESELDVLVAAALARLGVDLAEKVQFRAVRTGRRRTGLVCGGHNAQVVPGIAPSA